MFAITEQVYKIAAIVLAVALIGSSVAAGIFKMELNEAKKENVVLVGRVSTLTANIDTQNLAVKDMKKRTKEYEDKLAAAEEANKETDLKLRVTLQKLKTASIPPDCDGKIEFLKNGLMEMSL